MQLPVLPRTRWRTQVGHTNRCQRPHLLCSDLLGQAQAERAVREGIKVSLRRIRAADCPQRVYEDPFSPWLSLPTGTGGPTGPGRCTCCTPGDQRQSGPEDMFSLVSRRVFHNNKPDVVLQCMKSQWESPCRHPTKLGTLADLRMAARQQRVKQDITGSNRNARNRLLCQSSTSGFSRDKQRGGKPTGSLTLRLPGDHTATKDALSTAPEMLSTPEARLDQWEETEVSAASLRGLPHRFQRCLTEMIDKISYSTVCDFHRVSCQYQEMSLQRACERWLELHLVTELSGFIQLRDLPFEVLHKTLRSPRVFAGCEYHLLKTVLYWVFLQFNSDVQIMPSHRNIIRFFSSWQRPGMFLEQPKGHKFIVLFQAVRLHGIMERHHLEELQMIRVFPEAWLLRLFSEHYYMLHSGGDIQVTGVAHQAVRFGMVVEKEPQCCTQIIELYGFYFLLKAAYCVDTDTHRFSLQRLRHSEPAMSVKAHERHPFSMMSSRLLTYQINVQAKVRDQWQEFCTGPINQEFGLNKDTCKSQVFTVERLNLPIFVTFALAFQAS